MPIPSPEKNEKKDVYISRCAKALATTDADKPQEQRLAICFSTWKRAKGEKLGEGVDNLKIALFGGKGDFSSLNKSSSLRMWRKQVLSYGRWTHPENKDISFEVTPAVVDQIIENFNRGIPVELPVVITHTDDPRFKAGTVRAYIKTDKGLDVVMGVSDSELNSKIEDSNQSPGVSCWLDLNYDDKQSGLPVGAVVKHVALVNHPYIEGMGAFEAVLSEDGVKEEYVTLVLSENISSIGEGKMPELTKDTAIKFLLDNEKVDVTQLLSDAVEYKKLHDRIDSGELVAKEDAVVSLSDDLVSQLSEHMSLSEEDKKNPGSVITKLLAKIVELVGTKKTVTDLQKQLSEMQAEREVGLLLSEKKIWPAEKVVFKKMWIENKGLYDEMAKLRNKPLVQLSEMGVLTDEALNEKIAKEKKTQEEIQRHFDAAKKERLVK